MEVPGPSKEPDVFGMAQLSLESSDDPAVGQINLDSPEISDEELLQTDPLGIIESSIDTYKMFKGVGSGTFGVVYKGRAQKSERWVAVKIFQNSNDYDMAQREFEICQLFSGMSCFPDIVEIFTFGNHPILVFEFLQQDLLKFIGKKGAIPIQKVRPLLRQLLDGLRFIQEKNYVHGDLKPSNIMIVDTKSPVLHLKIVDMGSARPITQDMDIEKFQTINFRAPEVLIKAPCSEKVDMWSLGCILAEMLLGRRIYPGNESRDQIIMITIVQGELPQSVLSKGRNVLRYYDHTEATGYTLKRDEKGLTPNSWMPGELYYTFNIKTLDDVVNFDESACKEEKQLLLNLLKFMLNTDSEQRCTPQDALDHAFFTAEKH